MANDPCLDAAKSIVGEDATDKQLTEIMQALEVQSLRAKRADPTLDEQSAYLKAADELVAERKLATLIAKRNRAFAVAAKKARFKFYDQIAADGAGESTALRSLTVGMEGPYVGLAKSVDAQRLAITREQLIGPMMQDLKDKGLLDVALTKDPAFEGMVAREMHLRNGGTDTSPTGNSLAEKMAEVFNKYIEKSRQMQVDTGAYIRKLPGYITRQMHDQVKIYRMGAERWKALVRDRLHPMVYDGVRDKEAWLDETWRNLASGVHERTGGDWLGGFEGPGNLAKRVSAERVLHFKSPEAWMEYNAEAGRSSLYESILDGMEYAARNTALMRTFGPNPEAAFKADVKQLIDRAKARNAFDEIQELEGPRIHNEAKELFGGAQVRGNPTRAMWFGSVRMATNMSTLGKVFISSITDTANRVAALRWNGVPVTHAWVNTLKALTHGLQLTGESAKAARLMGAGLNGMIGGTFKKFHAVDSAHDMVRKGNNLFFKANLLTAWTDGMERWSAITLAGIMGDAVATGRAFADFDPRHRITLGRYGITEAEWDVLRQAELFDADGSPLLMSDLVAEIPDTAIRSYIGGEPTAKQIAATREDLSLRLATYYSDQIREMLTFGGTKERAKMTWGLEKGTWQAEILATVLHFKQFPVTFITRHLNRELHRGGKVDKGGLAHLLASTTALGFVAIYLGELATGKQMQAPEDAQQTVELILRSIAKGGGGALYADILLGSTENYSQSLGDAILGPTFGKAQNIADIITAARQGDDPRRRALKAVVALTPGNNLFYARLALDHLFLYGLQEQLSPGYLRRYERNTQRDQPVEFWLPPTDALNQ